MNHILTAMGPDVLDRTGCRLFQAPTPQIKTAKYKYNNVAAMWMGRVGGLFIPREVENGDEYDLYAAMDENYQKMLDAALLIRRFKLGSNDKDPITFNEHKAIVYQILNHVTKKSPANIVRRFISNAADVYGCKRAQEGSYTSLVKWFREVTPRHLSAFHEALST